jgi:hypothetical protein
MVMLVVATPRPTASSINLRCVTPVPAIAIDRPSSPPLLSLPTEVLNAPWQPTASDEIPIASDAPSRPTSRGFLPWRFAYAGPSVSAAPPSWGRHPQTFTKAVNRALAKYCFRRRCCWLIAITSDWLSETEGAARRVFTRLTERPEHSERWFKELDVSVPRRHRNNRLAPDGRVAAKYRVSGQVQARQSPVRQCSRCRACRARSRRSLSHAAVVGESSSCSLSRPCLSTPVASIHNFTASPKLAAAKSAFALSRSCSNAAGSISFIQQPKMIVALAILRRRRRTE